ncbi:MAG: ABC transporter permease [Chloroflexi bacterium]|nr:ABC transporter permease [Chloroflexota bacterium]
MEPQVFVYAVLDALETGLPYMLAFLGVWLVFRIYQDFDLTVGGSFTLGASICAVWIVRGGDPWLALPLAAIGGALAGVLTYVVMYYLNLSLILSSIVVNTALFTINLRLLGVPDVSIIGKRTIVDSFNSALGITQSSQISTILVMGLIAGVVIGLLSLFLLTEAGLALRACGTNKMMARAAGVSPPLMLLLVIMMANGLTGLSGALVVQEQGFVDVMMGASILIFGVTGVLLGEVILWGTGPIRGVLTVVLGTLAYRLLLALAFRVGVEPQDFNALTASVVVFSLLLNLGVTRVVQTRATSSAKAISIAATDASERREVT